MPASPPPAPYAAALLDPADASVRAGWAALLAASEQRTPFATLAYAEAAAAAFGLTLRLAAATDAEGELAAGAVLFERRRGPYRTVVVPPLTALTPFVLARPPTEADVSRRRTPIDALLPLLDARYHALAFHLHPSMADVRPFTWAGYAASPRYTYVQRLRPGPELLAEASKNVRRCIRQAEVMPLLEGPHLLGPMSEMAEAVVVRHEIGSEAWTRSFRAVLRPLVEAGAARVFGLEGSGGEVEATQALLLAHGRAALLMNAGHGDANTILLHRVREALFEAGIEEMDFVGANVPGVSMFKRSFGPVLTPYYRVERYVRPELRALALARPFL